MENDRLAQWILTLESMILVFIATNIYHLTPAQASTLKLYELLGAVLAGMITTYGIYKMHQLT
ncbi:MAG: hypothetical protein ABEJ83_04120 [Candidatus Nanohaloarchaea archaeon]